MKIHPLFALSSCAVIAACAVPVPAPVGPTASMPQVECSVRQLAPSEHANRAQSTLNRTVLEGQDHDALYRQALEHARAGLAEDDQNPYHHLLAGWSAAGLGQLAEAEGYFNQALAFCPELDEEFIEPARMEAWSTVFGEGLVAFQAGDTATAQQAWERAAAFWDGLASAEFNLAIIHTTRGNHERAAQHYLNALRIVTESPLYEQEEVAPEGLEMRANAINGLIAMGVQFYQQERFERGVEIFREILRVEPNSRDAHFNMALSMLRMERWADVEAPARRVVEVDPLSFQARVILFNSFRGRADAAAAAGQGAAERRYRAQGLEVLQAAEQLPVRMTQTSVQTVEGAARISGQVAGTEVRGGPVTLDFVLYGRSGEIGRGSTTFDRPAQGEAAAFDFRVPVTEPVTGWRYSVR